MKPSPNPNDRNSMIHYHLKSLNAYPRLKVTPVTEPSKNPRYWNIHEGDSNTDQYINEKNEME